MPVSAGDFKQAITKIFNSVTRQVFSVGIKKCAVEIGGNMITIVSEAARIPILKVFDKHYPLESVKIKALILEHLKDEIKKAVETELKVKVKSIFKDYDPSEETSVTVIILDKDVDEYLKDMSEPA